MNDFFWKVLVFLGVQQYNGEKHRITFWGPCLIFYHQNKDKYEGEGKRGDWTFYNIDN